MDYFIGVDIGVDISVDLGVDLGTRSTTVRLVDQHLAIAAYGTSLPVCSIGSAS